jgi:hypothetical protein
LPNSPPTDLKLRFTFFQNYQKSPPLLSKYFQECNENVNKTETMAKKNTLFCWRYLKTIQEANTLKKSKNRPIIMMM